MSPSQPSSTATLSPPTASRNFTPIHAASHSIAMRPTHSNSSAQLHCVSHSFKQLLTAPQCITLLKHVSEFISLRTRPRLQLLRYGHAAPAHANTRNMFLACLVSRSARPPPSPNRSWTLSKPLALTCKQNATAGPASPTRKTWSVIWTQRGRFLNSSCNAFPKTGSYFSRSDSSRYASYFTAFLISALAPAHTFQAGLWGSCLLDKEDALGPIFRKKSKDVA